MPPKPKFTKDHVISVASGIIEKDGLSALSARVLEKELGCASSPIFTLFSGMDEIKESVIAKAREEFIGGLNKSVGYEPAYKEYAIRWVDYARKQPNLYKLIFKGSFEDKNMSWFGPKEEIAESIGFAFSVDDNKALEITSKMVIYLNGLSQFIADGSKDISDEQLCKAVSELCLGYALQVKAEDGSLNPVIAKIMAKSAGYMPEKL